jgi:PKHD-type hydroxylase
MIERMNRNKENSNYYTDYEINLLDKKNTRYLNYASYYIIEDVFNKDKIAVINNSLSKFDNQTISGSVVGKNADESKMAKYRNSDILFLEKEMEFEKKIVKTTESVNKNIFNFNLTSYMNPQYTIYNKDMYFDWHPDGPLGILDTRGFNCIPDNLDWRKLSAVLALSAEDSYIGGDFQILVPSSHPDHCIHTIRLDAGSMIFFPSFLAHRVTPVTAGTRKTLVFWFCGPRWQ